MSATTTSETWRVLGLELDPGEDERVLVERAAAELGLAPGELRGARIARLALDARKRGGERRLRLVGHVDLVLAPGRRSERFQRAVRAGRALPAPAAEALESHSVHASWSRGARAHVAVVGSGPAGLFAALALARNGIAVTVLERGPIMRERGRCVARFHRSRVPDPERNLLFGEGGAGTYSDGKIYTRVDDPLEVTLLEELVACGAPADILYHSLAHIGTDRLHRILPRLRERMTAQGCTFRFDTRLDGLIEGPPGGDGARRVRALATSAGEIACDALVLAPGHSARDTWEMLARAGVAFEAKPFQLGLRIEHPQELVDLGRYGGADARLGAAGYNLVCKAGEGLPAAFTFCMCPGGRIVASVNEPGHLCTNGMSNSRHSSAWATSALVTTWGPREFGSAAFDGVAFQRRLERLFFDEGGGDYTAPAQTAADFLAGRLSSGLRHTTYPFGTRAARLDRLLPEGGVRALARALRRFDAQLPGFAGAEGTFVGLESRSSGPVRMPRGREDRRALGFANLYPVGEGAGYAGGIMSAALDGARAALALVAGGRPDPAPAQPSRP
jgi:uncharacterized FAD-dependent dehydrogenase